MRTSEHLTSLSREHLLTLVAELQHQRATLTARNEALQAENRAAHPRYEAPGRPVFPRQACDDAKTPGAHTRRWPLLYP